MTEPVLSVRNLKVEFPTRRGTLTALDDVSFDIMPGEVLGMVGESGAGKSMTSAAVVGLIDPPGRTESNYRVYGADEVHVLRFIKRARTLGFSVEETGLLLGLWQDKSRSSAEVREIASGHVAALETKIAELETMVKTLKHLVHCCQGDDRPDCPILDDLAGTAGATKGH